MVVQPQWMQPSASLPKPPPRAIILADHPHPSPTQEHPVKNLGDVDRTVRLFAGTILGICLFALSLPTNQQFWLGIFIEYVLITGLAGWSPLYAVLRRSTRSAKDVVPPPA